MAAQSISFELITRVREFYTLAYQEISSNKQKMILPWNGITDYAIPCYILSVAAVEAFVNEFFLGIGSEFLKGTSFDKLSEEEKLKYQKENLGEKLITLPKMAFDQEVLNRGSQPFQDMSYLVKVRDSFVHYKMGIDPEYKAAFDYLENKKIAITSPDGSSKFWASDLCTFEGIIWAHNTSLKVIKKMIETAIKTNRHKLLISIGTETESFFHQIPDPQKEQEPWKSWMNNHTNWIRLTKKQIAS